jgi:hypothetical protein
MKQKSRAVEGFIALDFANYNATDYYHFSGRYARSFRCCLACYDSEGRKFCNY